MQIDLFAAPAPLDSAVLEPPPVPDPDPVEPARWTPPASHAPGPWAPSPIGNGLEVATCVGCAKALYRPPGREDAQLLRLDAYRGGLTTAGVCRPVERRWRGPKPGRHTP